MSDWSLRSAAASPGQQPDHAGARQDAGGHPVCLTDVSSLSPQLVAAVRVPTCLALGRCTLQSLTVSSGLAQCAGLAQEATPWTACGQIPWGFRGPPAILPASSVPGGWGCDRAVRWGLVWVWGC